MEIHPAIAEYLATIDLSDIDQRNEWNQEAKVAYWFHMFMDGELSRLGRELTGYVFRQQEEQCLLVVKSRQDGTQDVVFCTDRTPIGCMKVFCRKLYADTLVWKRDKYV
jgi:hypothetical protein